MIARLLSDDPDVVMPPSDSGKRLSPEDIQVLQQWVKQGAKFTRHWSYEKPIRPVPPPQAGKHRVHNPIDLFVQKTLRDKGLSPAKPADRYSLGRRLALDLTGLPLTPEEADAFANDQSPQAIERLIDELLQRPTYGEHWARMWLDLARYADSAGYADDPPRTIWGYRDWVIRAINNNMSFDQFTKEQIAGDLLPDPTTDQLVATAFHRNTLTNNEGGTQNEEFRNVAVVDRVNTTMAVWMGTTMACAQCHTHKYDPITHEEYFRLFAILNNTADADLRNEAPVVSIFTAADEQRRTDWQQEIATLQKTLSTSTPKLKRAQRAWEKTLQKDITWNPLVPQDIQSNTPLKRLDDGTLLASKPRAADTYTLSVPLKSGTIKSISALQLNTLTHKSLPSSGSGHGGGNFVITRVQASVVPPNSVRPAGRFVRVVLPGKKKFLSLAEVQVLEGKTNHALGGKATQHSTDFGGPAQLAIDGKTDGIFTNKSVTHTAAATDPWWEVDLGATRTIDRVVIWNRMDDSVFDRLANFNVRVLDKDRNLVWEQNVKRPPKPSTTLSLSNVRPLNFVKAIADYSQPGFAAANLIRTPGATDKGWAVGGATQKPHTLTLLADKQVDIPPNSHLKVVIEQKSKHTNHTLGRFEIAATADDRAAIFARMPEAQLATARKPSEQRSAAEADSLSDYFLKHVAADLAPQRKRLAEVQEKLAKFKPSTSVPILKQLPRDKMRETFIQIRGNYLAKGDKVQPGLPSAFGLEKYNSADRTPDRMTLANWLMDPDNPLTARVIANRYWEALFGRGLVATSEEFGAQGELPSHPELLDWLATELIRLDWDVRAFLKLLVSSATYQQSSIVDSAMLEADPDNRWLARGPRFRISAEMIRDQTLFVSGLLSPRMYGPPVKPPQPSMGLTAAFGGGIDWKTSTGEDKFRRGIYTTWRRSNPYPSMVAFDAPTRQVCTVRRSRTNTPLQALVTLNDPVYIEAAQALARKSVRGKKNVRDIAQSAFRACLVRPAGEQEIDSLTALFERARAKFATDTAAAEKMATQPIGPLPEGTTAVDMAAWTVVCNVILNLDEMFLKR